MTAAHILNTHLCTWGFAAAGNERKATVAGTIHDMMAHLRHVGVGGEKLRQKSSCQNRIYELQQGRRTDFKFEIIYNQSKGHTTLLYCSIKKTPWVEAKRKMNDKQLEESPWFQALPKHCREEILKATNPTVDRPQKAMPQAVEFPKSP